MDSTTDNSFRTLWGIIKAAGAPDFLVDGALVDGKDAQSLPCEAFADMANRRFPLTDRANTWASAGYFAKTASSHGYSPKQSKAVLYRIRKAAEAYGIAKEVDDAMAKVAAAQEPPKAQVKTAFDSDSFCDPDHRGYPVFDKAGAEMASDFFSRNAYKYGHARRMGIAKNIMRKCAQFGVEPSEQVRLSAGMGFPNRDTLAEGLLLRTGELLRQGRHAMAAELCKFATEICEAADEDLDRNREGLFDAISGIDEVCGMDDCYGRKFLAPEEMVFDITPDAMREVVEDAVPMGGETLSAKALSNLPRALFERVLPKEVVDGMMDGGTISPKRLSVTIVSLKSPETSHLLRTIRDYTDGAIDIPSGEGGEGEDGGEKDEGGEKGGKGEKGEKGESGPEGGKDARDEKDGKED